MLEILKNFEQAATQFSPVVLVVPGLLMVALGLFVWLGGLGFRRVSLALVGALVGGFCALVLVPQSPAIASLSALVTALTAVLVQRLLTAVLLGALSFSVAFVIVARPLLAESHGTLIAARVSGRDGQRLTSRESLDVVRATALDLADSARHAAGQLTPLNWAIIAAASAGWLTLGLSFRHLGGAVSCASLGTAAILGGLVTLLIFKGSTPVTYIEHRAGLFGLVLVAMIVFGTLEQLVLCRRADQIQEGRAKAQQAKKGRSKEGWRNR